MSTKKNRIRSQTASEEVFLASGRGQLILSGKALLLMQYFDENIRRIARKYSAAEHKYPTLITRKVLEKLDYFSSFPDLATFATHVGDRTNVVGKSDHVLSPAVCYHTYSLLKTKTMPLSPYVVTAVGSCFRFEGKRLKNTPERLWDFTMREIVFLGSPAEISDLRARLMVDVTVFMKELHLAHSLKEATDPFFLGTAKGKLLIQKFKKLKYEICVPMNNTDMAIASFVGSPGTELEFAL